MQQIILMLWNLKCQTHFAAIAGVIHGSCLRATVDVTDVNLG